MGSMSKKRVAYEVALNGKEQIAEGTYAFTFEKPEGFHFCAGQHVRMTLIDPTETDAEGNSRFFTMASTPQEPYLVFAMRMRDTAFKRVLSRMRPGEKVLIELLLESPHESFVLYEDASKPAVFIVGGIGIVPAYSMIKDAIQRNLPHKMFLFYSNRRPEDAPFLAELQDLAKQNASFKLIATITEPERSAQSWQGETGFINRAMLEKYVDDLKSPIYYVAGLPDMVGAMQTVLAEVGVSNDNIRAEEFAGFEMGHDEEASSSEGKNHPLGDDTSVRPTADRPPSTPRWVKVFGIIVGIVVLLFVILLFTRGPGGHGPGMHGGGGGDTLLASVTEDSGQQP
jgi:ferredoxin-NADP reductase